MAEEKLWPREQEKSNAERASFPRAGVRPREPGFVPDQLRLGQRHVYGLPPRIPPSQLVKAHRWLPSALAPHKSTSLTRSRT